jgi:hypothetical protein
MEFVVISEEQKELYREQLIEMLKLSDKDFVPPLSARSGTLQKDLKSGESSANGVIDYYNQMNTQKIICAIEDGLVLGFVSYIENFVNEVITKEDCPNIYLSTLVLRPEARGKNLTYRMYDHLFNTLYASSSIFTRTWSTNIPHLKILSKFDFDELLRKKDDRGEGIDTVYYCKKRV